MPEQIISFSLLYYKKLILVVVIYHLYISLHFKTGSLSEYIEEFYEEGVGGIIIVYIELFIPMAVQKQGKITKLFFHHYLFSTW